MRTDATLPSFPALVHPEVVSGEELTQLDLDLAHEVMKPRDLASILEPTQPPEATSPEVARLLRQVGRLHQDLDRARAQRAPAPPRLRTVSWILVAVAALMTGVAGGYLIRLSDRSPPTIVLVAGATDPVVEPKFQYPTEKGIPSAKDRAEAAEMLAAALEHLHAKNVEGAEHLLGLCIEMADLAECHRTLGTLLAFEGDPAARVHLQHYVDVAPAAPDAADIRRALQATDASWDL